MTEPQTTAGSVSPASSGQSLGTGVSALGGILMIVGAFLDWLSSFGATGGTGVGIDIFWSSTPNQDPSFFTSAGLAVIVIGVLTLAGSGGRQRGLTMAGGSLGVLAYILFVITLYRVDLGIGDVGIGMWLILAGAIAALVGLFLPASKATP